MSDKEPGNSCLHVEVSRSLNGNRLWAWKIYAGEYECPIDESRPIFSSSNVAMNIGVTVRDYIYYKHGASKRVLH